MTPEELHVQVQKIKDEMVRRASEGDEDAKNWLHEVYPEDFPSVQPVAVNKAVPPTPWCETDREPGEDIEP